jgi:HAD superfamily hydrolase (TIGR01509 family)
VVIAVVFDADETVIDLRPAVTGALAAVLDEMRRTTAAAAEISLADVESDWGAVFGEHAAEPVGVIRRAALRRSLARAGLEDQLDRFAELFFARRFALSRPFDDVLPTLATLRPRYRLGLASNGNSRAERCGLPGAFAFEVYAHVNGVPKKPAPAFFATVAARAGATPDSIVHVGDSPDHDVVGAQAAGLRAVWLNRAGRPRPDGLRPDAEIRSLRELPAVVATLAAASPAR